MPLLESIALTLAAEHGPGVALKLLKDIANVQDEQLVMLRSIHHDVQRMIDGPYNDAMLLLREAISVSDPGVRQRHLNEALSRLISAHGLEPQPSARRAAIRIDLALLYGLLGDLESARRWTARAYDDQTKSVEAAVASTLSALNTPLAVLKSAVDGDFWSQVETSSRKDPEGTDRWIREKYEDGEPPLSPVPIGALSPRVALSPRAQDQDRAVSGPSKLRQVAAALSGRTGADAANDHHSRWIWAANSMSAEDAARRRPFLAHIAIAETLTEGGRQLMRLHQLARDAARYQNMWVTLEPTASAPAYELLVDLAEMRHARIGWQPATDRQAGQTLSWSKSFDQCVTSVAFTPTLVIPWLPSARQLRSRHPDRARGPSIAARPVVGSGVERCCQPGRAGRRHRQRRSHGSTLESLGRKAAADPGPRRRSSVSSAGSRSVLMVDDWRRPPVTGRSGSGTERLVSSRSS